MPARVNRRAMATGEGPSGTSSRMVRGEPWAQVAGFDHHRPCPDHGVDRRRRDLRRAHATTSAGIDHGSPRAAARSRATPAMQRASGRLAEMSRSKTTSGCRSSASTSGTPGAARPAGRTSNPSGPAGEGRRSSSALQSIPFDHSPRILRREISNPPGRTVPTGARGTRSPTWKFQAPHTICGLTVAGVDVDQADALGVRVVADVEDSGQHDVVEALADLLDAFNDQAEAGQQLGQLGRGGIERGVVA